MAAVYFADTFWWIALGYSLTDCRSMLAMRTLAISEVLSNDHHFTQEGFTVLFP